MERPRFTLLPTLTLSFRLGPVWAGCMGTCRQLGRLILIAVPGIAALLPSNSLAAESRVLSTRGEHSQKGDPDAPVDFDIPRLPLSDALARFAKALNSVHRGLKASDAVTANNIWVGPVKGRMTPRKAFERLTAHVCAVSLYEEVAAELSYDGKPIEFQYLSSPPLTLPPIEWNIPRMSRERALDEVARQVNGVKFLYASKNVDGIDQQLVGPITGRMSPIEALDAILSGTDFAVRWVDDIIPTIAIKPAMQGFVASDCSETILVTQQSLPSLDFGSVVTISRREIEDTGASTVPELLTHLSETGVMKAPGNNASGAQYADFRGTGAETWLVLINGRRAMPSANNVFTPAFDLATIPLTAVERIEVQLDSASTRYGSDAIAGVIDIVTFREVNRPTVEVRYGSARGGAAERRGTLSFGAAGGAPWRVAAVLDTFEMGGLLGNERAIAGNQDYRRYGGLDYRRPFGVRSLDGDPLPGLDSAFAFLPSASEPVSLYGYRSLVPEGRRNSFVGVGEYVGGSVTGTAEFIWVRRNSRYAYFPATASGVVSADHPSNPFDEPVFVDALLTGLPSMEQHVDSELTRAVLGVRGPIGEWNWSASALSSNESTEAWIENAVDGAGIARALAASEQDQALDVFSERPGFDHMPAGVLAGKKIDRFASRGEQLLVMAEGPTFSLPAGAAQLRLGFEYRREAMLFDASVGDARRSIRASHAEVTVPLVDPGMRVLGVRALKATAGVRRDSYSDAASPTKQQYSVRWDVTGDLALGATSAKAYRPASQLELELPVVSFPTVVFDMRQNRSVPITFVAGGNENLQPSSGASHTFYASYTAPNGTRALARYWSIDVSDRIAPLPIQTALEFEADLPDRVHRAEPTEQELAAGMPGRLLAIDTRRLNYGRLSTSGIDIELMKEIESCCFGSLTPKLAITWIESFEFSDAPMGYPLVDRVGLAHEQGSITEWRAVGSLAWEHGRWRAATQLKFVPAYYETKNNHEIGSQTIWDAHLSYSLSSAAEFTLGVRDILDTSPHFAFVGAATGFDWTQWDPVGRRWSLMMRLSF